MMKNSTFVFILLGFDVILLILTGWLYFRYKKLFRGKSGSDLERLIMSYVQDITLASMEVEKIKKHLKKLQEQTNSAMQKISLRRFNPFDEMGGDQSFTIALLNKEDSGFVITSLYTREGVRIYAKHVDKGKAENQLMDEEKVVLEEAMKKSEVPCQIE